MRIAVLDDVTDSFSRCTRRHELEAHEVVVYRTIDEATLVARLAGFEAVLLTQERTSLPRSVLEALPSLRLVVQTGRKTQHIDVAAAKALGMTVSAGGVGSPHAPAELTWALILASQRDLVASVIAQREGRWQTRAGEGLHGKTLGIWAFGRIGAEVATVGRAFGMKVLCHGRSASLERARDAGFEVVSERDELFARADVLSLHLPLVPTTEGIVRERELALMKPTALFVNTSRARLLAPGALLAALERGRPGRAAIDVFDREPTRPDDPLVHHARCLATPHLGYVERGTLDGYYGAAIDMLLAYAKGAPIHVL